MIHRPDLVADGSPEGLEVFQLTAEDVPSAHVYMEAQVFTPDSNRFVLHRSAHPHGSDKADPRHRYMLCDLENGGELSPLTDELATTGPAISPDGQFLYYFVDQAKPGSGRLMLKRVRLDGTGREGLAVLENPLDKHGTSFSRAYPLSTISSDGKRIVISGVFGDARTAGTPWGFVRFDIEAGTVESVPLGPDYSNLHPQYSRSLDIGTSRDVLIQHNHGEGPDPTGQSRRGMDELGADIHVVCDDGTQMRDMPWGRDGNEFCQGHQCWIGRTERAITSTGTLEPEENQLIEGLPAPHANHVGSRTPGGYRNDLSRSVPDPHFFHFATDIAGQRFITDSGPRDGGGGVYAADLPQEEGEPLVNLTYLLNPRSSWDKTAHIHPFLSPDGELGFFNSDESGLLQAYMVRGF